MLCYLVHANTHTRAHHIQARISHRLNVTVIVSHRAKVNSNIFYKHYNEWKWTNSVEPIKHNCLSCTITRIDAISTEIYWRKCEQLMPKLSKQFQLTRFFASSISLSAIFWVAQIYQSSVQCRAVTTSRLWWILYFGWWRHTVWISSHSKLESFVVIEILKSFNVFHLF